MTEQELDRLASLIAGALLEARGARSKRAAEGKRTSDSKRAADSRRAAPAATWVPAPVRPEPPSRGGPLPHWSGAAQQLGDVAPMRGPSPPPPHRATMAELTVAARAAAAGRGAPPAARAREPRARAGAPRPRGAPPLEVLVGVSNRHLHLAPADARVLFGTEELSAERPLRQPGQFAATQTVSVVGPDGRIDGLRVVGPARGQTQVELALADCRRLGIAPPIRASGSLIDSAGGVSLVGPSGAVKLERGVIVAARHLHLSADDARRWGLRDGDRLDVRCGSGPRDTTFHDVLVRAGETHATELHLDSDEALAAGVRTGDRALVIAWRTTAGARRTLLTERDVIALAREGRAIPAGALLTPSARDRARALELLR